MKKLSLPSLIALLAILGAIGYNEYGAWRLERNTAAFMAAIEKPYREDTYGGKTPEETWALFLAALKKGDVEEASKYVEVEKQEEWEEIFKDTLEANKLEGATKNLEDIRFDKFNDSNTKAYFFRTALNEKGEKRSAPVVFTLNQFTKVWKISVL
jgi:hypothetical protein